MTSEKQTRKNKAFKPERTMLSNQKEFQLEEFKPAMWYATIEYNNFIITNNKK